MAQSAVLDDSAFVREADSLIKYLDQEYAKTMYTFKEEEQLEQEDDEEKLKALHLIQQLEVSKLSTNIENSRNIILTAPPNTLAVPPSSTMATVQSTYLSNHGDMFNKTSTDKNEGYSISNSFSKILSTAASTLGANTGAAQEEDAGDGLTGKPIDPKKMIRSHKYSASVASVSNYFDDEEQEEESMEQRSQEKGFKLPPKTSSLSQVDSKSLYANKNNKGYIFKSSIIFPTNHNQKDSKKEGEEGGDEDQKHSNDTIKEQLKAIKNDPSLHLKGPDNHKQFQDLTSKAMDLRLLVRKRELAELDQQRAKLEAQAAQAAAEAARLAREAVKNSQEGEEDSLLSNINKASASSSSKTDEKKALSDEDKVRLQQNTQESIAGDILSLVATIKENALRFQESITHDTAVLNDTAESLEKSSGLMGNVGSRLNKYHKSTAIGWWFYIWATLGMIAAVVIGMLIIQLFPKW